MLSTSSLLLAIHLLLLKVDSSYIPLPSSTLLNDSTTGSYMDWCIYFRRLNIYKPECKFHDDVVHDDTQLQNIKSFPLAVYEPPKCSPHHMYCTSNSQCGDGYLRCIDMTKFRECCSPVNRKCPPINYLNFRCLSPNPINWCEADSDCNSTPQKLCCPTGCNYNICL